MQPSLSNVHKKSFLLLLPPLRQRASALPKNDIYANEICMYANEPTYKQKEMLLLLPPLSTRSPAFRPLF